MSTRKKRKLACAKGKLISLLSSDEDDIELTTKSKRKKQESMDIDDSDDELFDIDAECSQSPPKKVLLRSNKKIKKRKSRKSKRISNTFTETSSEDNNDSDSDASNSNSNSSEQSLMSIPDLSTSTKSGQVSAKYIQPSTHPLN